MGSNTIDRAFFELNSNAPDVEKGFKSLLNAMAGTQDKVRAVQQKFQDLQNTHQTLIASIAKLEAEHAKYSEVLNSGTQDIKKWSEASDQVKRISKELEDLDKKAVKSKDELANAQKKLSQATQDAGTSFQAFGQAVGNFISHPVQTAQSGLTSLAESMGPVAVGAGAIVAGVAAAGYAMHEMAMKAGEAAQKIQNMHYATGLTVETVQALERAGKERGLSNLLTVIEKVNMQLGAQKGGPFTEALLKAGIPKKEGEDAIYYIEELRKKYALFPGDAEKAQIASGELQRRLTDLYPIVMNDEESFTKLIGEIRNSSAVMGGPAVDALVKYRAEMEKTDRTLEGLSHIVSVAWSTLELSAKQSLANIFTAPDPNKAWWRYTPQKQEPFVGPPLPPASISDTNILEKRASIIAAADAVASGKKGELIALQVRLNDLEQQYTEAKSKRQGYQFDEKEINSLAEKIRLQKQAISDLERGDKAFKQLLEDIERDQAAARLAALSEEKTAASDWQAIIDHLYKKRLESAKEGKELSDAAAHAFDKKPVVKPEEIDPSKSSLLRLAGTPEAPFPELKNEDPLKVNKLKADPQFKHDLQQLTRVWDQMGNDIAQGIVTGFKDGLGMAKNLAQGFLRDMIQITWSNTIGKEMSNLMSRMMQGAKSLPAAIPAAGAVAGTSDGLSTAASSAHTAAQNTKFLGVGGKAGGLLMAGAVMGGTMLMEDAFRRGGTAGAFEGAGGGALAGAAIGTMLAPGIGTAIGAGIGAMVGFFAGFFGGGDKRRAEELARRTGIQESQMFTSPTAIDRVEAFGADNSVETITSLVGKEILYSSNFKEEVVRAVNQGIMNNDRHLADNIAYASGS